MAEPARQFDEDERPGNVDSAPPGRPELKKLEGGGDTSPPTGDLHSVPDSPESLGGKEQAAGTARGGIAPPAQNESLYKTPSKAQTRKWLFNKRRTVLGGGAVGTIVAILLFFAIGSGPLQFIHIAQLMEQFHFSANEDAADGRFMQTVRYLRDPTKPQNVRLGVLANRYANKIEAKFSNIGVESLYTEHFGFGDGFAVDPAKFAESQLGNLRDKSPQNIKKIFKEQFGYDLVEGSGKTAGKLVLSSAELDPIKNPVKYRRLVKRFSIAAGTAVIPADIQARVMGKRAGVTWHPIKKIDNRILRNVETWWTERIKGVEKGAASPEPALNSSTKDGDPQEKLDRATNVRDEAGSTSEKGKAVGNEPSKLLAFQDHIATKLTGGAAAVAGILCLAKSIPGHADEIKHTQVVLPLMRMGVEAIAVGNQVKSGQDVNLQQLGKYSKLLNGTTPGRTDQKPTSWSSARSIQAELGQPQTGPDADKTAKGAGNSSTPFDFLNEDGLGTALDGVCSSVGQALSAVISFAGGPISTLVGFVVGQVAIPPVESALAHWLAGEAIDPNVAGADYGNYINYGARLAANDQAISTGGRELNATEVAQLKADENADSQYEFKNHNIAYKLLNPYDSRSYISKVIDQQNPDAMQNVSNLAYSFLNISKSVAKLPQKLFLGIAHAAPAQPYDYGFSKYGFSTGELNNPLVKNPINNACHLFGCINETDHSKNITGFMVDANGQLSDAGQKYVDRAKKCFNIIIEQDDEDNWGVSSKDDVPRYSDLGSECKDSGDDWLRVRFFIFDTQNMDADACYEGDEQSCINIGMQEAPTANPAAGAAIEVEALKTLNGQDLSANQSKWIKYIAENVVSLLPGTPDKKATMAAQGTWWSLREGVLDQDNPFGYSNCAQTPTGPYKGNDHIGFTDPCKESLSVPWQVGIAAVQVPNASVSNADVVNRALALHPGMTAKAIIAQLSVLADHPEGDAEYNKAVKSAGYLRRSLLMRDPATGFFFSNPAVVSECLGASQKPWCVGNSFSSSPQVISKIVSELYDYYRKALNTTPAGGAAGATIDTAHLYDSSVNIACANHTKDLGIEDGYSGGNVVKIRVCALPNLPSTDDESNDGYGVSGANGGAVVNSRVSGAVYAMVEAAKKDGVTLTAISSFRSMAHQQYLCDHNTNCSSGTYDRVARPGTSNHQAGLAIDFGGLPSSAGPVSGNAFWEWLSKNADSFGYKNYPAEAWHWSPTGN
ncbi:hypothetical protein COU91_02370 [Candidatus Saccharibacteria bacterium CG10_big_fil_rev_8_21_14_0_10_47_8]|nr:MAG: hypothetical protein COU91_02370 [Candidatus Saccharibacteria bacterium CG10_big_fil_rev_8_21_14_0_10_47_8]